jgi:methyl-accepting chemotaxis protein
MLHAFFVILETGICLRIVWQLSATVRARGILEEQVSAASKGVNSGTREIEGFVHTLASTASTQAQMVEEIAAASQSLQQDASSRESLVEDTNAKVEDAVTRISECRRDLDQVNRDMAQLAEANRKVAGVMALVTDIARQTNILAVNASIEASRSGAAGAGFGIIADQVRDLAQRTAEAARDIENVLSSSMGTVERNTHSLGGITKSMHVIEGVAFSMSQLTRDLVSQGKTQASELARIATAMQKISAGTQHLASGAEESSSTSSELARQARDLDAVLTTLH